MTQPTYRVECAGVILRVSEAQHRLVSTAIARGGAKRLNQGEMKSAQILISQGLGRMVYTTGGQEFHVENGVVAL